MARPGPKTKSVTDAFYDFFEAESIDRQESILEILSWIHSRTKRGNGKPAAAPVADEPPEV